MAARALFLLQHAQNLLRTAFSFERALDSVVSDFFRAHKNLGQKDRALLAELVYFSVRHKRFLEALSGGNLKQIILLSAFLENKNDFDVLLNENEKAFFQHFDLKEYEKKLPFSVFYSFPDWLLKALPFKGKDLENLCRALNQKAPFDLRINPLKIKMEEGLAAFPNAQTMPFSPFGFRLKENRALYQHPLFLEGKIEVQDEGSQLVALLTNAHRRENVADFCAGAGGKSLLLGAMMKNSGTLYGIDISEKRLYQFKQRFKKSGLSNIHFLRIENEKDARLKRLKNRFDCVLADVPCSGTGTLRRNPDLKWRQNEEKIKKLNELQLSILNSASSLVKKGGRLIYSTCSLLPMENENIAETFLKNHTEFKPLHLKEWNEKNNCFIQNPLPDFIFNEHGQLSLSPFNETDGFFAAAFVRE